MSNYDDYMAHIRAAANARKPLTRAELQCIGVYLGLVAVAALIALATGH
ncbi:hypothetical protein SAMN02800692_2029 [Luteibacter sp. UNC138MFCol5.1]|nr:hypothetical protein [Luteibacter sp. UNC138MFCol5.1]SEO76957.1 hypothetical protein SAMN02800692_2029 [Luteibacter sp. UNC138MFCol5.1]